MAVAQVRGVDAPEEGEADPEGLDGAEEQEPPDDRPGQSRASLAAAVAALRPAGELPSSS
jgi:hypothetical protein